MFWVFLWGLELFQGYASVSRYLCVMVPFPAYTLRLCLMCFFYFGFMKIITKLLSTLLVFWNCYGLYSTFCHSYMPHLELSFLEFFLKVQCLSLFNLILMFFITCIFLIARFWFLSCVWGFYLYIFSTFPVL